MPTVAGEPQDSFCLWLRGRAVLIARRRPIRRTAGMAAGSVQIGVTNRIRTGTNAVTGRDAAVTS